MVFFVSNVLTRFYGVSSFLYYCLQSAYLVHLLPSPPSVPMMRPLLTPRFRYTPSQGHLARCDIDGTYDWFIRVILFVLTIYDDQTFLTLEKAFQVLQRIHDNMHITNVSSYKPLKLSNFIIAITPGKNPGLVIGDGECAVVLNISGADTLFHLIQY